MTPRFHSSIGHAANMRGQPFVVIVLVSKEPIGLTQKEGSSGSLAARSASEAVADIGNAGNETGMLVKCGSRSLLTHEDKCCRVSLIPLRSQASCRKGSGAGAGLWTNWGS